MFFLRAQGGFVANQYGGVEHGISQRRQGQASPACRALARDQRQPHVLMVEVIKDDTAVVNHVAIGQAQGRELARRIVFIEFGRRADRRQHGRLQLHTVELTGFMKHHHHFAGERRSGVEVQRHRGRGHGCSSNETGS